MVIYIKMSKMIYFFKNIYHSLGTWSAEAFKVKYLEYCKIKKAVIFWKRVKEFFKRQQQEKASNSYYVDQSC